MSLEKTLHHIAVDGFYVVENVIQKDEAHRLGSDVWETVVGEKTGPVSEMKDVDFQAGLIAKNQSFAKYLAHPDILGVSQALFGEHVRISFTSAIINNPDNSRGKWHSDWPFNQQMAGHIPAPYPDVVMHLTTIWMLSPFSIETGGTLIVPGSHKSPNNPTGNNDVDPMAPYPTEMHATGDAGSVLLFDSRCWHATATNNSEKPRVGVAVRYAPWWLNLDILMLGSDERKRMVDETGFVDNQVPPVPEAVFEGLPDTVKPLFRHWVR